MNDFKEFEKKYPETAKSLLEMSKEEILEHYALEVAEKDELAEFKEDYEETTTNLECIINFGIRWLRENKRDGKHHIYIDNKIARVVYTNTEKEFI